MLREVHQDVPGTSRFLSEADALPSCFLINEDSTTVEISLAANLLVPQKNVTLKVKAFNNKNKWFGSQSWVGMIHLIIPGTP